VRIVFGLIASLVLVSPTLADEIPTVTLRLDNAGTIMANRVWEQGDQLCYDSRGYQACFPKRRLRIDPGLTPVRMSAPTPSGATPATSQTSQTAKTEAKPPASAAKIASLLATKPRFSRGQCEDNLRGSGMSINAIRIQCANASGDATHRFYLWKMRTLDPFLAAYTVDEDSTEELSRDEISY
jgi:hypothetical protein